MSQSPYQIVAIEDNGTDLRLLRYALDELGHPYHLKVFEDGDAALGYVRTSSASAQDACLIILDLNLPRCGGITILQEIRNNPSFEDVALAVMTTLASPADQAAVESLGVSLYRTKPMNWDAMLDLARELIELCRSGKKLPAAV